MSWTSKWYSLNPQKPSSVLSGWSDTQWEGRRHFFHYKSLDFIDLFFFVQMDLEKAHIHPQRHSSLDSWFETIPSLTPFSYISFPSVSILTPERGKKKRDRDVKERIVLSKGEEKRKSKFERKRSSWCHCIPFSQNHLAFFPCVSARNNKKKEKMMSLRDGRIGFHRKKLQGPMHIIHNPYAGDTWDGMQRGLCSFFVLSTFTHISNAN